MTAVARIRYLRLKVPCADTHRTPSNHFDGYRFAQPILHAAFGFSVTWLDDAKTFYVEDGTNALVSRSDDDFDLASDPNLCWIISPNKIMKQ